MDAMSKEEMLNFRVNKNYQSLGELWESLDKIVSHRVTDNANAEAYPLKIREAQLRAMQALIDAIKHTHTKINREIEKRGNDNE